MIGLTLCLLVCVGHISGIGSGVFVPKVFESIGDVVPLVVFVPKGVDSKSG